MDLHQCLSQFLVAEPNTIHIAHSLSLSVRIRMIRVAWRTLMHKHTTTMRSSSFYPIEVPLPTPLQNFKRTWTTHNPSKNGNFVIYPAKLLNTYTESIMWFMILQQKTHKTWNITYRFHSFSADLFISPRHLPIKLLPNRPPLCTSKASCHRPSAAQAFKATMPARSSSSTLPWNRLSCCFFQNLRVTFWCRALMMTGVLLVSFHWWIFALSLSVCVCLHVFNLT